MEPLSGAITLWAKTTEIHPMRGWYCASSLAFPTVDVQRCCTMPTMSGLLDDPRGLRRGGEPEQHGLLRSAALHLGPGVVLVLFYLLVCAPLTSSLGLPRQAGAVLKVLLGLCPLQLGYLAYLGYKRHGRLSLQGVVGYRRKLPARVLGPLVMGLFLWALLVIALLSRVDDFLLERLFHWVPISLLPETELAQYGAAVLLGTHVASLLAIGVLAPVTEELYFRGHLLPRISWMAHWAPVWNTVLFNLYHLHSPWRFISRTIFTLPMVYAVWRKKSISIGIWWHCLGNILGELIALRVTWNLVQGLADGT